CFPGGQKHSLPTRRWCGYPRAGTGPTEALQTFSHTQIDAFLNRKLEEDLSSRTLQYMHAVLRSAYSRAVKWHLVIENPAKLADAPIVHRDEIQPLNPEDARPFPHRRRQ